MEWTNCPVAGGENEKNSVFVKNYLAQAVIGRTLGLTEPRVDQEYAIPQYLHAIGHCGSQDTGRYPLGQVALAGGCDNAGGCARELARIAP